MLFIFIDIPTNFKGLLRSAILKDENPITIHFVMIIPALLDQATAEQQAFCLSRLSTQYFTKRTKPNKY
ncbi:hypothetical protein HZH66_014287 [Vespula vulgaris]|uniref:Acyl-coenzyme A oxidase N-terminal domain-containing protein n=1 Tax=Vespula vulgaris TaxID=7454 RepID=A0A834J8D4_VESVU|nr:hypothetical protein HZH66_014287 [Vespula vulgaris]